MKLYNFLQIIKNIIKILFWILLLYISFIYFNYYGIISVILFSFIWNILMTLYRSIFSNGFKKTKSLLKIIFTTNFILPFSVYGCYCSPKYGVDGESNTYVIIDDLDFACFMHDRNMLEINAKLKNSEIIKKEYIKLKNKQDMIFISDVFKSENSASGLYLLGLLFGFLFRIIWRKVYG